MAIQGGAIFTSEDGGLLWDSRWASVQDVYFDELHFPSEAVGYATGGHGSVLRTVDGGVHWNLLSFAHGDISAADFFDEDHGIVATALGELYATADGGANWQLMGPTPGANVLMDIAHRDATHWYGVSYQGCLYETRNAGMSWETGYCDANAGALVSISLRGGPAVAGGNGGVVLWENRILENGFD